MTSTLDEMEYAEDEGKDFVGLRRESKGKNGRSGAWKKF